MSQQGLVIRQQQRSCWSHTTLCVATTVQLFHMETGGAEKGLLIITVTFCCRSFQANRQLLVVSFCPCSSHGLCLVQEDGPHLFHRRLRRRPTGRSRRRSCCFPPRRAHRSGRGRRSCCSDPGTRPAPLGLSLPAPPGPA